MDSLAILNRIEEKRNALGITKTDLYRDCHITASAFSQWKTGETKPSPKSLSRIAAYLDTTFSEMTTLRSGYRYYRDYGLTKAVKDQYIREYNGDSIRD